MKSKLIKLISMLLVASVFCGFFPFVMSNAVAEEGTSQVSSFEELNEMYDKFIYLGLEAYEDIDGELILTDYYVDPGDWIYYRIYLKSDLYIGSSKWYTSYDNSFFDTRVCTEEPVIGPLGYERNNKNAVKNPKHPMVKDNGAYNILTSIPATEDQLIKRGYCELDKDINTIDVVINQLAKDTINFKKSDVYTSDEWLFEWKVQVKEHLEEGQQGELQIYKEMFRYYNLFGTDSIDARRPANISVADCEDDIPLFENAPLYNQAKPMNVKTDIINHLIVDDTKMTFTVGRNPEYDGSEACMHSYQTVENIAATCNADGKTVYECIYCGDIFTRTTPATDHVAGDWEIVINEKVSSATKRVKKCILCKSPLETEKLSISILSPEPATVNLGDSIWLHSSVVGNLPEGTEIVWTQNNSNFEIAELSEDGKSCKVTCVASGTTVFVASVVDSSGNIIIAAEQQIIAQEIVEEENFLQKLCAIIKDFFNKIIEFFGNIFG